MKAVKKVIKKDKATKVNPKSKPKTGKTPKVMAAKTSPKLGAPKVPFKQSEFYNALAEQVMLSKKDVKAVLEGIKAIVKAHLVKNGPGQIVVPGLLKITSVTKPATKARKGRNPFTGEEMMIKAKPSRKVIKVKALKKFKNELE